jgi:uncharacterized protein
MSRAGTIDGLRFAQDRSTVTGRLALADLPRVAESGASSADVRYAITGRRNAAGKPSLRIEAAGMVELECQRCLQPLAWSADAEAELELAASEAEANAAEDDVDRVVASKDMDVAALVEDEVLLGLPMVPLHASCEAPAEGRSDRPSPFAVLAALKKGEGA